MHVQPPNLFRSNVTNSEPSLLAAPCSSAFSFHVALSIRTTQPLDGDCTCFAEPAIDIILQNRDVLMSDAAGSQPSTADHPSTGPSATPAPTHAPQHQHATPAITSPVAPAAPKPASVAGSASAPSVGNSAAAQRLVSSYDTAGRLDHARREQVCVCVCCPYMRSKYPWFFFHRTVGVTGGRNLQRYLCLVCAHVYGST